MYSYEDSNHEKFKSRHTEKELENALQISEIDEGMFLVEFSDGKDKQKVLEMWPWSFEKQLIVLKEFEEELVPRDIVMKHCPFWVQIFNLPLKSRTKESGRAIGSTLREVLDIDVSESGVHWGRCLRLRVSVDITKKLICGKKINIEGGENRWVRTGGYYSSTNGYQIFATGVECLTMPLKNV